MEHVDDVRRWASARAAGIMRMVVAGESLHEDVTGAIEDGDLDYAAYVARELVLRMLSVAGLQHGGELDFDVSQAAFDWFEGAPDALVDRGRTLALAVVGDQPDDTTAWLAAVSDFVADVEATLGLDQPMPRLRAADGMYPALALARDWIDICAGLGGPVGAVGTTG